MMMAAMAGGPGDPHTQMNTYRSYVTMLADPGAKDEIKLKAAQELSENFEVTIAFILLLFSEYTIYFTTLNTFINKFRLRNCLLYIINFL